MTLPIKRPFSGEVLPRLNIEIRPENPGSSTWRVYAVNPPRGVGKRATAPLSKGGYVLGGSKLQAYRDAEMLESEGDFFFKRPDDDPTKALPSPFERHSIDIVKRP